jgi:hypothetical protein
MKEYDSTAMDDDDFFEPEPDYGPDDDYFMR